ncbi:hypothetical protein [Pseudomonas sp. NPDC099000]|uniref:hypothetical protein n=1 Tax=Pseudomonas sp. NPDC099000 TaxID=3364488 RepID=UPI00383AE102
MKRSNAIIRADRTIKRAGYCELEIVVRSNDLEGIRYTSDDGDVASAVTEIIELMKVDIKRQQSATQALKDRLSNFKIELSGGELSGGKRVFGLYHLSGETRLRSYDFAVALLWFLFRPSTQVWPVQYPPHPIA